MSANYTVRYRVALAANNRPLGMAALSVMVPYLRTRVRDQGAYVEITAQHRHARPCIRLDARSAYDLRAAVAPICVWLRNHGMTITEAEIGASAERALGRNQWAGYFEPNPPAVLPPTRRRDPSAPEIDSPAKEITRGR